MYTPNDTIQIEVRKLKFWYEIIIFFSNLHKLPSLTSCDAHEIRHIILLLTLSLPNYEWRGRKQMIDVTVTFCLYHMVDS